MKIDWALPADAAELSELWFTCFGDDEIFRNWFFGSRFWPEYCLVARTQEKIIGAVYGLPTHLWLRQKSVPAVIIGGVSTHPDHRGKGVMRCLFSGFIPGTLHRK